jgi:hypothetical protein
MRIRIHALVQYSDDLDHVSDPVVNHVGPFEEFAVAGIDFVAGVADRVILTNEQKCLIELSQVMVSLCFPPLPLSETTNLEQILSCGA